MVHTGGSSKKKIVFLFVLILLVRTVPLLAAYIGTGTAVLNPFELDPLLYLGGAGSILASGVNEFPFTTLSSLFAVSYGHINPSSLHRQVRGSRTGLGD